LRYNYTPGKLAKDERERDAFCRDEAKKPAPVLNKKGDRRYLSNNYQKKEGRDTNHLTGRDKKKKKGPVTKTTMKGAPHGRKGERECNFTSCKRKKMFMRLKNPFSQLKGGKEDFTE